MSKQTWLQHALAQRGFQPQNQVVALIVLGILIVLVFGGIYLSQVANFATTNRQIEELIAVRDRLERTNEQLRAEIAALETVPRLLARARELGFRQATANDIEYLVVDGYNPNRDRSVVPLVAAAEDAPPVYEETFGGWLQQQFDALRRQFESFGR